MQSFAGNSNSDAMWVLYSFVYCFFAACFIAPPTEFVSAGLTVQALFSAWLGSEGINFVAYHLKRTTLTLIIHSTLPLGYYIGLSLCIPEMDLFTLSGLSTVTSAFLLCSLLSPVVIIGLAFYWHKGNCDKHPMAHQLSQLSSGHQGSWGAVASSINVEFRRIDKFTCGIPSRLVVVTDSWIIKTSTYFVYVAHQNDIHLTLSDAVEHNLSYQTQTAVQYLNITVGRIEPGLDSFTIRLNALELGDLKEKLQAPIRNARNIVIHQSMSDLFLKTFREQVAENPLYIPSPEMEVEQCIGCMQKLSDVKLQKQCGEEVPADGLDQPHRSACVQCYCRPMWCLECMGKWFASRQDQAHPETWLASRSPCPTCRATFCVLDVCKIQLPEFDR